jgi:hypothetical protein
MATVFPFLVGFALVVGGAAVYRLVRLRSFAR